MIVCIAALLSAPVLIPAAYLGLLAAQSRRLHQPEFQSPQIRFDIIVPAHNEESGISATISSLQQLDYPPDLVRILVIADNCSDATARYAEAAGARVHVRTDPNRRGKGYALEYGFSISKNEAFADAVVVVDADTSVSSNLLRTMDAAIRCGAQAVQAEYGVRNPDAGWRTRLMSVALSTHHRLRNLARERMGLSVGLHGNGMAFTHTVLTEVPHEAFSIVEDLEYGIRLGYAGYRVHYAADGAVFGEMVASEQASRSQRVRWESGRNEMLRRHAVRLLGEGLRGRNRLLLDLGIDLLVPPLSYLTLAAGFGLAFSTSAVLLLHAPPAVVVPWVAATAFVGGYVIRGALLSPRGARAVLDLARAPAYVGWKLLLKLKTATQQPTEWIRTQRHA